MSVYVSTVIELTIACKGNATLQYENEAKLVARLRRDEHGRQADCCVRLDGFPMLFHWVAGVIAI